MYRHATAGLLQARRQHNPPQATPVHADLAALLCSDAGSLTTAALLAGAPEFTADLGRPLLLGVARALLDMHARIASAARAGSELGWHCSFPHRASTRAAGWRVEIG